LLFIGRGVTAFATRRSLSSVILSGGRSGPYPKDLRAAFIRMPRIKQYGVYILTNPRHSSLYVGVTSDLTRRMHQHQVGLARGFSSRYNLQYLVHFEETSDVHSALAREKQLKCWWRSKKKWLIDLHNPERVDLSLDIIDVLNPSSTARSHLHSG